LLPVPELIPEHKLLSESEAKKVAAKFNARLEDFPKILSSDPQAVKLGAEPGQLIEIKRNDDGNKYLYYRYVVKG
jgi:DNA-directed RNA polymerase subunit H